MFSSLYYLQSTEYMLLQQTMLAHFMAKIGFRNGFLSGTLSYHAPITFPGATI